MVLSSVVLTGVKAHNIAVGRRYSGKLFTTRNMQFLEGRVYSASAQVRSHLISESIF